MRKINILFFLLLFGAAEAQTVKGTFLLFPRGNMENPLYKAEAEKVRDSLNRLGFMVVPMDYPGDNSATGHRIDIEEGAVLCRVTRKMLSVPGLLDKQFNVIGISFGAYVAAKVVQRLKPEDQPDHLILLYPDSLDRTLPGTVLWDAMPPAVPQSRLLVILPGRDSSASVNRCREFVKTWIGYDGEAAIADGEWIGLVDSFLNRAKGAAKENNPAALAVQGHNPKRHEEKLALVANGKYDLILIGNSITNNFEKPEYLPVWNQFFAPRKVLNLGFSGYRTENLIWNIEHGELEGQSPKVAILEIGTNNIDEKHYPTRHTAGQLAGGITRIVQLMREKMPDTKIILLRCFPGCYGGPNPTSHRAILERASDIVSKLADNQHVFYCDVNHVFLNLDGAIRQEMMKDWLHPTPEGARAWAKAMEPLLSQLMGDASLDTDRVANTAIVPTPKLEDDHYNWWERHAEVLRIKDSLDPEVVLIGNSITHFWGGRYPAFKDAQGRPAVPNGPKAWDSLFGATRVLNLGFGWDRTQNVLWRLDHGELDGLHPRTVIIDIGTNNTSQTAHARMNTADEIVEGIRAVIGRVRSKVPGAEIVVMEVFPREKEPQNPRRLLIGDIDRQLEAVAAKEHITLVNIGPSMLEPDGHFKPGIMLDYTHPTEKGYQLWADAIEGYVR